jgi:7-keto-8-aminopelargonate synthetase-like enzyme
MSYDKTSDNLPAPCIIESGTIVNKDDIRRLLKDLKHVRYIHTLDSLVMNEGEGCLKEIFADPHQATLIANNNLYINICSFDYLQLHNSPEKETYIDLIQDNRQLRLIPLSNSSANLYSVQNIDPATLEAMVTQVLSAKWDVQFDDDDSLF